MKIAVDGRALLIPPTGISNYLLTALNAMAESAPEATFYLLINRDLHEECRKRLKNLPNIVHVKKPFTKIALFWYATRLYYVLKELQPDYFWAPAGVLPPRVPKNIKTIITVHDFVAKEYKKTMSFFNRIYNELYFASSVRDADIVWSVSEYTKDKIKAYFPKIKAHSILVGSGVDRSIFKTVTISADDKKSLLEKLGVGEKFILYVGTLEPRKNLPFLLSLMPQLAQHGFYCLIVGCKGWGNSGIKDIVESEGFPRDKVVFSGFVSTDELVQLYNLASVFVSTSLNEGFGLPQLEAMNCGCPVVCPHNSAMVEVVGKAGKTIVGWDRELWCREILDAVARADIYSRAGKIQAELFNWDNIATKYFATLS